MTLQGKRIAIMVDEQYQELEVWYPYYRFIEAGGGGIAGGRPGRAHL